jgi:hypothetical protein
LLNTSSNQVNSTTKSKLQLLLTQHLSSLPSQVSAFYSSNTLTTLEEGVSSFTKQDLNAILLEGSEYDHLKFFNSNFLTSLTATKSSNALTVHNIAHISRNSNDLNNHLKFRP